MTKGFITIATGDERYFKLASNLLKSYKIFSENHLPFAILSDRHNEYTALFDKVIILKDAKSSYMDKLSLLVNCPFDETIFIDADCLAYGDLNTYFNLHDFSSTISCFGFSSGIDYEDGWFRKEDIEAYKDQIKFIPSMHGGSYFLKRGPECAEMYKLALKINSEYKNYKFKYFDQPADEPILALCMAIFDCRPIEKKVGNELIFYPTVKDFKADILSATNSGFVNDYFFENSILIHWQNHFTRKALYKNEVYKLKILTKKANSANSIEKKIISTFEVVKIRINLIFNQNIDFFKASLLSLKLKIKAML